jgi:hypothetical protein
MQLFSSWSMGHARSPICLHSSHCPTYYYKYPCLAREAPKKPQCGPRTKIVARPCCMISIECSVTRHFEIFVAQVGDFPLKNSPNGFKCQNIYINPIFKLKNIYIKADLKPQKTYIKRSFEMGFIGKKLKMLMSSKVARMAKNRLIWSH